MLAKPDTCMGCPLWGDGVGFVPDEVPEGAQVVFVGQNPGATEEAQARPLVGDTGQRWRQKFVARHIPGARVGYANVIKCRLVDARREHVNELPARDNEAYQTALAKCRPYLDEALARAAKDAWIVPMGTYACAALVPEIHGPMLHVRGTVWTP